MILLKHGISTKLLPSHTYTNLKVIHLLLQTENRYFLLDYSITNYCLLFYRHTKWLKASSSFPIDTPSFLQTCPGNKVSCTPNMEAVSCVCALVPGVHLLPDVMQEEVSNNRFQKCCTVFLLIPRDHLHFFSPSEVLSLGRSPRNYRRSCFLVKQYYSTYLLLHLPTD